MNMNQFDPILAAPDAPALNLGSSKLHHRISSDATKGAFSVVEFVAAPGEGVGTHVHENEEELVYLLSGEIEVTLGDQKLRVQRGGCALLPRKIPHGFKNVGTEESRLLAVLLPGRLDQFFVKLSEELATNRPHEDAIQALCRQYGLQFLEN